MKPGKNQTMCASYQERPKLDTNPSFSACSCKDPVEPLTLDEIADRCHAPEEVTCSNPLYLL